MEFTAEDHLQPFAMPVGVEWTVKLSRLKNPFSGRDETIELTWSNGSSSPLEFQTWPLLLQPLALWE